MTAAVSEKYYYAAGRRKTAVAKVRLYPEGEGEVTVNDRPFVKYFPLIQLRSIITAPLRKVAMRKKFKVSVVVSGGGIRGQAEAARHGIARALLVFDSKLRGVLKEAGYLTRDPRAKERKKYGLKRARRAPQFSKR